ncbi:hypothetical protein [Nitrosomonas sp.]|uniref:hypothetical protein n=1 Tax=Nitrosomonas sp. TaxID=42353 RepID=UPI002082F3D8|nr:hypothetical protein [Nitrosomonas sp.]GJL74489.1 MAG: hypothetical protein NMNS02_05950 [Nitrosomonas sp.]
MKFYAKKISMVICSVAILGCGGWFTWQALSDGQLPLPVSHAEAAIRPAPSLSAASSSDELIGKIITLSGLQKQVEEIGDKLLETIRQSPDKPDDPVIAIEIEKIVAESYKPEHFHQRLREALKEDFDRGRIEKLVQALSTPLMKRITEIEGREFDLHMLEAFIEKVTREPLPTYRLHLLQALESVTHTTKFAIELTVGVKRAMLMGLVNNDDAEAMTVFDTKLNEQKKEMTEKMYPAMVITMAYVYQELNDAELDAYVQFYLTEEGNWFITQSVNALAAAFHAGSLQTGKRIAELTMTKKTK